MVNSLEDKIEECKKLISEYNKVLSSGGELTKLEQQNYVDTCKLINTYLTLIGADEDELYNI